MKFETRKFTSYRQFAAFATVAPPDWTLHSWQDVGAPHNFVDIRALFVQNIRVDSGLGAWPAPRGAEVILSDAKMADIRKFSKNVQERNVIETLDAESRPCSLRCGGLSYGLTTPPWTRKGSGDIQTIFGK